MKPILQLDNEYIEFLREIKLKVRKVQNKAAVRVNSELISMYWSLGKSIVLNQSKSNWGDGLISQLSKDLSAEFPEMKGFSETNLKYIRIWYKFYDVSKFNPQLVDNLVNFLKHTKTNEFSPQLVDVMKEHINTVEITQLIDDFLPKLLSMIPWGQNREIITKCKDIDSAIFYIFKTIENSWSRNVLVHQIESNLFERQGKSINNFDLTLPKPKSDLAKEMLKNPYSFEFLNIAEEIKEKELQKSLLDNITNFLLELVYSFAFIGKEKLLSIDGNDYYVDLLFYHTKLHCFFIVELKVDNFKPEYAGKLNFYLNVFNDMVKSEQDNPTIGLLLCKKANKLVAEYSLKNINNPIGISQYSLVNELPQTIKNELPSVEEIQIL
jgi:predicted nuclease of restriction endonuclease-like (RecB) superfamily